MRRLLGDHGDRSVAWVLRYVQTIPTECIVSLDSTNRKAASNTHTKEGCTTVFKRADNKKKKKVSRHLATALFKAEHRTRSLATKWLSSTVHMEEYNRRPRKEALCVWAEGPPYLPSPLLGLGRPTKGPPGTIPLSENDGGGVKSGPPSWYFLFVGCFKKGRCIE
ncbi:hypothetical protein CDAR_437481 [Caerostris darwini]|uniref:Transposase n=1 Tax=Caerostris darwini TaxID=1538125 RepID=A0AAV4NXX6_9ARAC|nr:hypothetical protein CDAR_437481 [Caerostris darwini]